MSYATIDDLSPAERRLLDALASGATTLDLRPGSRRTHPRARDLRRAHEWGADRRVRGEVIAALDTGAWDGVAGPGSGIDLQGALITGTLDLRDQRVSCPVALRGCVFEQPLLLDRATTRTVNVGYSRFPAFEAAGAQVNGDLRLTSCRVAGRVRLRRTRVSAHISLRGARVFNPGIAVNAIDVVAGRGVNCAVVATGRVEWRHAQITGTLNLNGARVSRLDRRLRHALNLQDAVVTGDVRCRSTIYGGVTMKRARILGNVRMRDAVLDGQGTSALNAAHLTVGRDMSCVDVTAVRPFIMPAIHVTGDLNLSGAGLTSPGPSLCADHALVGGEVRCVQLSAAGTVVLSSATINGDLVLSRARVQKRRPTQDNAVSANGMAVRGHLTGRDLATKGGVELIRSTIAGDLDLRDAELSVETPMTPLKMAGMTIGGDAYCSDGLTTTGEHADQTRKASRRGKAVYWFTCFLLLAWPVAAWLLGTAYFSNRVSTVEGSEARWYAADFMLPVIHTGAIEGSHFLPSGQWVAIALTACGWLLLVQLLVGAVPALILLVAFIQPRRSQNAEGADPDGCGTSMLIWFLLVTWPFLAWLFGAAYFTAYEPALRRPEVPGNEALKHAADLMLPIIDPGTFQDSHVLDSGQWAAIALTACGWLLYVEILVIAALGALFVAAAILLRVDSLIARRRQDTGANASSGEQQEVEGERSSAQYREEYSGVLPHSENEVDEDDEWLDDAMRWPPELEGER